MALLLALLGLTTAIGEVVELGDFNITKATTENDYVLIQFYKTSCSHCHSLAPHYAKAAEVLKEKGVPVILAKINSANEWRCIDAFKINSYPTMKFFEHGTSTEYTGGRNYQEIVDWITKRIYPTTSLSSVEELQTHLETVSVRAFVLFGGSPKQTQFFIELAKIFNGISFIILDNNEARRHYDAEKGDFVLFKPTDERQLFYNGSLNITEATKFLLLKSAPVVSDLQQDSMDLLSSNKVPMFIFFVAQYDFELVKEALEDAKDLVSERYLLRYGDLGVTQGLAKYFSLSPDDMPVGVFAINQGVYLEKYKYLGNIDGSSIKKYYRSIVDGTAMPYYRSEPDPQENAIKLTRNTYNNVVNDPEMNVVVAYTTGYSKEWKPFTFEYLALANTFNESNDIRLKVFDLEKNDPMDTSVTKIPTIKLYTTCDKTGLTYEGELTSEKVEAFIRHNTKTY